jgi:hypothetical protein
MKPMAAQTLSNNEHSTNGELSGSVTEHRCFLSASDFALEGASASIARMCGLL